MQSLLFTFTDFLCFLDFQEEFFYFFKCMLVLLLSCFHFNGCRNFFQLFLIFTFLFFKISVKFEVIFFILAFRYLFLYFLEFFIDHLRIEYVFEMLEKCKWRSCCGDRILTFDILVMSFCLLILINLSFDKPSDNIFRILFVETLKV